MFEQHSRGVASSRDTWVYNFDQTSLTGNIRKTISFYNEEVGRWKQHGQDVDIDTFVRYDDRVVSWSRDLKQDVIRERRAEFSASKIRKSLYRPFSKLNMFFDRVLNEEVYVFPSFFPKELTETENMLIALTGPGSEKPFLTLVASEIVDLHLSGADCSTQCFPFYTYAEDGTNRRENITEWALEQFRTRYNDRSITKWDIFHYVYAVLHHPEYRERYAANLRRELPRIPFASVTSGAEALGGGSSNAGLKPGSSTVEPPPGVTAVEERPFRAALAAKKSRALAPEDPSAQELQIPRSARDDKQQKASVSSASSAVKDLEVFRELAEAGQHLADIHVHYEQQAEYPLTKTEKAGEKLDYRVTRMRLSRDKTSLLYNQFLTLSGIPKETYDYRLGNRSALEWVIDQYPVSTDKRSGITNDPNRSDDPTYILRLIGQVVMVSLETVADCGFSPRSCPVAAGGVGTTRS